MSAGAVFQRSVRLLLDFDLPDVALSDLLAVLDANRAGPLQFLYEAAIESGLERDCALDRCASIYLNYCAGQLADDLADRECTYLSDPVRTGPAVQFLLQNLFYVSLLRSQVPPGVIEAAAGDLIRGAGPQQVEVRTDAWSLERTCLVAEGLGGAQFSCYLRLLWAGTPLEDRGARVGRALGIAGHIAADSSSHDPRYATLPPGERKAVHDWVLELVASLRSERLACVDAALRWVEPALEHA